jgi:hypothetical protein
VRIYKNQDSKWCYDFTADGVRHRRIVGLSKQECQEVAQQQWTKMKRHGFGLQEPRKNIFFEAFARDFMELYAQIEMSRRRDNISFGKNPVN